MSDPFAEDPEGDGENTEEESFADLLESYSPGLSDDLEVGEKITVKIISMGDETVFVDTGSKIDGIVDRAELLDKSGQMPHVVGDSLTLYVVEMTESEIRLSKAISGVGGLDMLQNAFSNDIPVTGRVSETCKGGFRVEILQRSTFCPVSQMDVKYIEEPEIYVGQTGEFLITRLAENGKNIVVSRKKLLAREQQKAQKAFLAKIQSGDILPGTVTRIMPYGAFVEVAPGLEGMAHISELSWSRVETAGEVVGVGDTVDVRVIGIEPDDGKGRVKLSLSVKQVGENPWHTAGDRFKIGDRFNGKVTRCADFGAFVEISPGIEGLVHVSEMSYVKRVVKPDDMVSPGQMVPVTIKDFDPEKRRISLSMRDAEGDPWLEVNDKFKAGQRTVGTVEKRETFGLFVALEPGVVGLLHKSKIARSEKPGAIETLKIGESIPVVVEKIDVAERRITLNVGDAAEEGDWQKYSASSPASMGSLGEQLQQALNKQKKS